jgi:hypothetical protein
MNLSVKTMVQFMKIGGRQEKINKMRKKKKEKKKNEK